MQKPVLRAWVIDDDVHDIDLLRAHLSHVKDFAIALEPRVDVDLAVAQLLHDPQPDLLFLDYRLGPRSGLEVLEQLRGAGFAKPIILFTGASDTSTALLMLRAGASDYVSKQEMNPEVLTRTLRYALDKYENEQKLAQTLLALQAARDDLASILDRLRLGVVVTDDHGLVTYVNDAAVLLFGRSRGQALGAAWAQLCPASPDDLDQLNKMATRPQERREKVSLSFETAAGERRAIDVEVHDEPRDPRRKILFFYDVSEVQDLRRELEGRGQFHDLVGRSAPMVQVIQNIRDLWTVDATVLIDGETGTGKELVARAIHDGSARRNKPFVAVNCASLSESLLTSQLFGHRRGAFTGAMQDQKGLFEAADGGTIFLDEIGDVPMAVQTNLLRVLQEREITRIGDSQPRRIDVRVLAATNRSLAAEVEKGTFRMDLLYRLRVARIHLPALRDRRNDIPMLVKHFLGQLRAATGKPVEDVGHEALRLLLAHDWPGNVRELKSALEFAVIHCRRNTVQAEDLPPEVVQGPPLPRIDLATGTSGEKSRIIAALHQCSGSRARAARLLGISRATFYRKISQHDLNLNDEAL